MLLLWNLFLSICLSSWLIHRFAILPSNRLSCSCPAWVLILLCFGCLGCRIGAFVDKIAKDKRCHFIDHSFLDLKSFLLTQTQRSSLTAPKLYDLLPFLLIQTHMLILRSSHLFHWYFCLLLWSCVIHLQL